MGESGGIIPAVLYAAKSTQDKHLSIKTQLENGHEKAGEEGWVVIGGRGVGEFWDEGFSAYSGNRGPDLRRAEAAAAKAADEYGTVVMLIVQHSDRLARGAGDKPGASDSLIEVWHRLRRKDVHVRSFQNDSMMGDPVLVAVAAKQAYEESERKSKAIKDGKRRRVLERGEPNGALQFGYRFHDPEAKHKRRVIDPEEAAAWRHCREMLRQGKNLGEMARWLNGNGITSKRGNPFSGQRVKYLLASPYYAGKITRGDGTTVDGAHDPLISWEEHEEICGELDALWMSAKVRGGRKPKQPTLLGMGVMRCAHCGGGIWHRRQQSGKRDYMCGHVRRKNGVCDALPFDAPTVERAVLDHLDGLFVDLGGWIEQMNEGRQEGRRFAERQAADLMRRRDDLDRDEELVREDYMRQLRARNEKAADLATAELERIAAERADLDSALADADAQLAEWEGGEASDEVLDWWTEFSTAIREDVIGAASVAEANSALRDKFAAIFVRSDGVPRLDFVMRERPPGAPLVSSSLWVDEDPPDDWPTFVDWEEEAGQVRLVKPNGRQRSTAAWPRAGSGSAAFSPAASRAGAAPNWRR